MDEKRCTVLPLILAMVSLVIFVLPLSVVLLVERLEVFSSEWVFYRTDLLRFWIFLGWLPALVTAIFAFKMSRHTKNKFLRIVNLNFSFLALSVALFWAIVSIFAIIFSIIDRFVRPSLYS